jgi:hypothetical protein
MTQIYRQIVNLPFLYINGLEISNNATTPNTKLDVAAGICRDSTNSFDLNLGNFNSQVSDEQDANASTTINAAANGLNGLDTGSLAASTLYYVYVIADALTGSPTGALLSATGPSTGPLMPNNYSAYRHIGYAITDGSSNFLLAYVSGNNNARTLMFDAPQATAITAGNATSYTDVVLTAFVPPVQNTPVYIASALTPGAAGRTLKLQPVNATGDAITVTGQVNAVIVTSTDKLMARLESGAPKIAYKVANSGDAVALNVAGFDFYI